MNIKALGEHVILVSLPPLAGDEEKTESGIIIGRKVQSELPEYCTVYSIGNEVPEDFIRIGDKTALPTTQMRHVTHPDIIAGKPSKEVRERYITVHYRNIPCVYKE